MNFSSSLFLRRRYIVDKTLQYGLIARMVAFVLFTLSVMSVMLFLPLVREMRRSGDGGTATEGSAGALLYMHEHFWPAALVCLVVAVCGVIVVSHRIAGPLVRVKRIMRFVTEGHFPQRLNTRPRDFFKEEVNVLNEMVTSLAGRIEELKITSCELTESASAVRELTNGRVDRETAETLALLSDRAEHLGHLLAAFTSQVTASPEDLSAETTDESPVLI